MKLVKRGIRSLFKWGMMMGGAAAMLMLAVNLYMVYVTKDYILSEEQWHENQTDVILVLGCAVKPNGQPSQMLEDRMRSAASYFQTNPQCRMFVSGDHQHDDYNEVKVMRELAVSGGVPAAQIDSDDLGLNTFASVLHTAERYPGKRVAIVSQSYHLYRAVYLARQRGMDAYGVSADLRPYALQFTRELRELAARVKDFVKAMIEI